MDRATPKRTKRSQRDYTLGFKLSIVEQVEKGEMTYKQAQATYGIQGRSTVLVWLRKHGKLDWSKPCEQMMSNTQETPLKPLNAWKKSLKMNVFVIPYLMA